MPTKEGISQHPYIHSMCTASHSGMLISHASGIQFVAPVGMYVRCRGTSVCRVLSCGG